MKTLAVLYGVVCYVIFFLVFLYAIGFVGDVIVPKGIDDGVFGSQAKAVVVDLTLLSIFAIQHSVMARPAFKAWSARFVPPVIERSTYVLLASLALALIFWQWRPLPQLVWQVASVPAAMALWALCGLGWLIVLLSTFLINHFDLFGLRQVWSYRRAGVVPPADFRTPLFYRAVRHPIYLGFLIAFWATPVMSLGHLLFAIVTSAYILVGIQLEERDLLTVFGDQYRDYRTRVAMLVPYPKRG